jgi:hypothetical protein
LLKPLENNRGELMNFFQVANGNQVENTYEQLTNGLAEFGLHPNDWNLINTKANCMRIENKSEPEFCFQGLYFENKGIAKWNFIQLVNL